MCNSLNLRIELKIDSILDPAPESGEPVLLRIEPEIGVERLGAETERAKDFGREADRRGASGGHQPTAANRWWLMAVVALAMVAGNCRKAFA